VAEVLDGIATADLTTELITHRFTDKSKAVLNGWYPGSDLPMEEAARSRKLTKFGTGKWVLPREEMGTMRSFMTEALQRRLPESRLLYWT
jgi:spore photoproduct lyase